MTTDGCAADAAHPSLFDLPEAPALPAPVLAAPPTRLITDPTLLPDGRADKVFWRHVIRGPGCWWWTGAISTPDGYGRITCRRGYRQRAVLSHRFALMLDDADFDSTGAIAEHHCNEPLCVRVGPGRLAPGSQAANLAYAVSLGRAAGPRQRAQPTEQPVRSLSACTFSVAATPLASQTVLQAARRAAALFLTTDSERGPMPPGDFTTMPTGQLQRRALLDELLANYADDREERHYLELKSDVDLATTEGRAKVAKFVLGAANRDPLEAGRYFDGHALMILGIAPPNVVGVPPFEDHELHDAVTRIIGDPGPQWDYERVAFPQGDVIVIVALPPAPGRVWPAMTDSVRVDTGRLYLRPSSKTTAANGPQVTAMLTRVANHQPALEVTVAITGNAWAVEYDEAQILQAINERAAALRLARQIRGAYGKTFNRERRTPEQYEDQINAWVVGAKRAIAEVADLVASTLEPVTVKVINRSTRYAERVRVAIDIDAPAYPLTHSADTDDISTEAFPEPVETWGFDPGDVLHPPASTIPSGGPTSDDGWVRIVDGDDDRDRLRVMFDELHPSDEVESDSDVVLAIDGPDEAAAVQGGWKMTVKGVDGVYRGTLTASIPVYPADITAGILALLKHA